MLMEFHLFTDRDLISKKPPSQFVNFNWKIFVRKNFFFICFIYFITNSVSCERPLISILVSYNSNLV